MDRDRRRPHFHNHRYSARRADRPARADQSLGRRGMKLPFNLLAVIVAAALSMRADEKRPFEIQVIDDVTSRGVPLVELETVNHVLFITDSRSEERRVGKEGRCG